MSRGRKRPPTAEELALWGTVVETVAPLGPRPPANPPVAEVPPPAPKQKAPQTPPPRVLKRPPPAKPPPALAPLDRRMRSRLTRGNLAIDRRLDLHGLTQATAERRLDRFLRDAQGEGARVVLVITGKGKAADEWGEVGGVLRRMVPQWLAAPAMRTVVVGFEAAAPNHGGAGALYVRIRKPRSG